MVVIESGMTDGRRADLFSEYIIQNYSDYINGFQKGDVFTMPTTDPELQFILKTYPEEISDKIIKSAIISAIATVKSGGDYAKKFGIMEEFKSTIIDIKCDILVPMHLITPDMEGKRIQFNCIINGLSDKHSYYTSALFSCPKCSMPQEEKPDDLYNVYIPKCPQCRVEMKLERSQSKTSSFRRIVLEEPMEESVFSNPDRRMGIVTGSLAENIAIGQRKKITGIFKSVPKDNSKKLQENDVIIDVKAIEDMDEKKDIMPTEEQMEWLKEQSKSPDFINKLVGSFTSKIGLYDEKLAILLSLVKGRNTDIIKRDDIHVFFMGNPSVAKSELLAFGHSLTPKSYSTGGESLSKAGLRGGIEQTDKYPIFIPGSLSMANDSHLFIDELDKIAKDDLSALYTAMEQQIVEYDKIIHVKLPANTSIIAAANPVKGYYMDDMNLQQNFNIPFALQTRFDLIFFIKSVEDESTITKISEQATNADYKWEPFLPRETLMAYLNWCRTLEPVLTNEAGKMIQEFWVKAKMASMRIETGKGIKIEPRHLHGLVRLAFAFAKLQLHETVTREDAQSAIGIFTRSLMSLGQDVVTGEVHQGVLTETPKESRENTWKRILNELSKSSKDGIIEPIDLKDVMLKTAKWNQFELDDWIRKHNGDILVTYNQKYKISPP